jgi:hypothetical protein
VASWQISVKEESHVPERDLAGRVAIITGSGQGLRRAIALELATHG